MRDIILAVVGSMMYLVLYVIWCMTHSGKPYHQDRWVMLITVTIITAWYLIAGFLLWAR